MNKSLSTVLVIAAVVLPSVCLAQSGGNTEVQRLHDVLQNVYNEMTPKCEKLTTVARGIAGFGAILYIAVRAGRNLANAEPIDFFPLLRPFIMAVVIGFYPLFLQTLDGILKPTVGATNGLVAVSDQGIKELLEIELQLRTSGKVQMPMGSPGDEDIKEWYKYAQAESGDEQKSPGFMSLLWGKMEGTVMYWLKIIISKVLQILFYASALCINAMRTFHLVILAILGPFVLALSTYDGFQHTLSIWLARFVNVYLWLPVANIFGAMISIIEQNMIKQDIQAALAGGTNITYDYTSISYLVFLIVGIVGYFSVPSISNYIVHASGGNVLMSKITGMTSGVMSSVASGGATGGAAGGGGGNTAAGSYVADMPMSDKLLYPMSDAGNSEGYRPDGGSYQHKQIAG
ncbi:conjugative transposon protein TraJ [Chitinophaga varians]|uniref:conjugative transposon protein TraJ n=1 Tax=Chitinophaga varians TaxID=2202339 RepID=UPI00165FF058|nr:conjugative transposon protein TraJ [Chitinophaga varians]MBC9909121.1 conjugative transposon protein TraJ [Chitinophaga varians]